MRQEYTLYQAIKEILIDNYLQKDIDESKGIITRKELISTLIDEYDFYPIQHYDRDSKYYKMIYKRHTKYSLNTLDNIRNMFEKTGYLNKCFKPNTNQQKIILGHYSINKLIPDNLSYNQLRKEYNQINKININNQVIIK